MAWIKIRAIRKESCFTIKVGETFNIEKVTGIRFWNSPIFLISIKDYTCSYGFVDSRVDIKEVSYPIFIAEETGSFATDSYIDVYATEGDLDTVHPNQTSGTWIKTLSLSNTSSKKGMYELNKGNDYSIVLPEGFNSSNYNIFYSFTNVVFPYNMVGYSLTSFIENGKLKIRSLSKNAKLKSVGGVGVMSLIMDNPMFYISNVGGFKSDGLHSPSSNVNENAYLKVNGEKIQLKGTYGGRLGNAFILNEPYVGYKKKDSSKSVSLVWEGETDNHGMVNSYGSYLKCCYADANDVKTELMSGHSMSVLVVWGGGN